MSSPRLRLIKALKRRDVLAALEAIRQGVAPDDKQKFRQLRHRIAEARPGILYPLASSAFDNAKGSARMLADLRKQNVTGLVFEFP